MLDKFLNNFGNYWVRWLLRSPLHKLLDGSLMVITVSGRKTGKKYSIPVQYVRRGRDIYIFSRRRRTWWRNLQGGAQVQLKIGGRTFAATGGPLAEDAITEDVLAAFDGTLLERPVRKFEDRVIVKLRLGFTPAA